MSDPNPPSSSMFNIGDLAKPFDSLINRVADAVGIVYEPRHIKRLAKAEAEAETIRAVAEVERNAEVARVAQRLLAEESVKQANVGATMEMAEPFLLPGAKPDEIDVDWILRWHERAKLVSKAELQEVLAKILAGEANKPGSFSYRTLEIFSTLEKDDLQAFTSLCRFAWSEMIFMYDYRDPIYTTHGIYFETLSELDALGLIRLDPPPGGFVVHLTDRKFRMLYHGKGCIVTVPEPKRADFEFGYVRPTKVGNELMSICHVEPIEDFFDYCVSIWKEKGYNVLVD